MNEHLLNLTILWCSRYLTDGQTVQAQRSLFCWVSDILFPLVIHCKHNWEIRNLIDPERNTSVIQAEKCRFATWGICCQFVQTPKPPPCHRTPATSLRSLATNSKMSEWINEMGVGFGGSGLQSATQPNTISVWIGSKCKGWKIYSCFSQHWWPSAWSQLWHRTLSVGLEPFVTKIKHLLGPNAHFLIAFINNGSLHCGQWLQPTHSCRE